MGWLVYAIPERDVDSLEHWLEIVQNSHGKDLFEFEMREPAGLKWMGARVAMLLVRYGASFPEYKRDIIDETCMGLLDMALRETGFKDLCLRLVPAWRSSLRLGTMQVRT